MFLRKKLCEKFLKDEHVGVRAVAAEPRAQFARGFVAECGKEPFGRLVVNCDVGPQLVDAEGMGGVGCEQLKAFAGISLAAKRLINEYGDAGTAVDWIEIKEVNFRRLCR